MSHIEKEKLIKADIASIENRVRHAFNQGYDLGFKDGKERTKPLEQEPFKPMVEIDLDYVIKQKYIERDVLDKIRADITKMADTIPFISGDIKAKYTNIGQHDGLEQALEIIEGNIKGDFDIDEWMAENE